MLAPPFAHGEGTNMALTGKTAILFGAGAIATGYAPLFAERRMNMAVVSRGESCEKLAASLAGKGSNVVTIHADASNPEEVRRVFHEVAARFGTIDICVNGSGGTERAANFTDLDGFLKVEPEAIQKMLTNNYLSKVYSIQQFAAFLHQAKRENRPVDGSIVNITSMSGFAPLTRVPFYSDAFAAVESHTRSMAFVFGHYGLGRVNNVAVGFLVGEQNRRLLLAEDGTPTTRGLEILNATSQHRFLTPADVARPVLYLADNEVSAGVNGHTLRVDGGFGIVNLAGTGYSPVAPKVTPANP
jgi:NAD(P)-dependent dehydrogenase (short-subunit alcohol dehydrogenase family)